MVTIQIYLQYLLRKEITVFKQINKNNDPPLLRNVQRSPYLSLQFVVHSPLFEFLQPHSLDLAVPLHHLRGAAPILQRGDQLLQAVVLQVQLSQLILLLVAVFSSLLEIKMGFSNKFMSINIIVLRSALLRNFIHTMLHLFYLFEKLQSLFVLIACPRLNTLICYPLLPLPDLLYLGCRVLFS